MIRPAVHGGPAAFSISGNQKLPRIGLLKLPPGEVNRVRIIFRILIGDRILNLLVYDNRVF
ncbi:hypothetical protein D3C73_1613000 [compost metagenome]